MELNFDFQVLQVFKGGNCMVREIYLEMVNNNERTSHFRHLHLCCNISMKHLWIGGAGLILLLIFHRSIAWWTCLKLHKLNKFNIKMKFINWLVLMLWCTSSMWLVATCIKEWIAASRAWNLGARRMAKNKIKRNDDDTLLFPQRHYAAAFSFSDFPRVQKRCLRHRIMDAYPELDLTYYSSRVSLLRGFSYWRFRLRYNVWKIRCMSYRHVHR